VVDVRPEQWGLGVSLAQDPSANLTSASAPARHTGPPTSPQPKGLAVDRIVARLGLDDHDPKLLHDRRGTTFYMVDDTP
jgi:hypothetical protein